MSYQLEPAPLDEVTTNKLRLLEEDLHCCVVALEAKVHHAELSRDQFAKIQHMERELGVSLVAYQATDYYRFASLPAQTRKNSKKIMASSSLQLFVVPDFMPAFVVAQTRLNATSNPAAISGRLAESVHHQRSPRAATKFRQT